MNQPLLIIAILAGFLGQQAPFKFEVASIRPRAESAAGQGGLGLETITRIGPSQIHLQSVTLRDCIALAYRVNRDRIIGPDWITTTRFDIAATLEVGAKRENLPEMLQALLVDRFRLRVHRDSRELPAYALGVRGNLKLETVSPDPEPGGEPITVTTTGGSTGIQVNLPRGATYALVRDRFEAEKVTMATLADVLSPFVGRPVVDTTGIKGYFNIGFNVPDYRLLTIRYGAAAGISGFPPDALQFAMNAPIDSLVSALRDVGLSLEPRRLPLEVIVVDSVERSPTEN